MEEKEASLLASIWNRSRVIIYSKNTEEANKLLFNMRLYIPQYRQLFICGDIPKEIKYTKGAKIIETKDPENLRKAFKESLAEEEIGAPPVQIIYFNADEEVFKNILKDLDRGWIATTRHEEISHDKDLFNICERMRFKEGTVYFLDPIDTDLFIEKKIIEETNNSSIGIKKFIIQMKESEVHLAFEAIQDELESGNKLTQSYISEVLDIREKTLKKIIETGMRERRLDISNYIEVTQPRIRNFLKSISSMKEITLAAVFDENNLIGYAKYRDIIFPTQNFLRLSRNIEMVSDTNYSIGNRWYLEVTTKNKNILIHKYNYLYGFVFEKEMDPTLFRLKIEKLLKNSQDEKI